MRKPVKEIENVFQNHGYSIIVEVMLGSEKAFEDRLRGSSLPP